MQACVVTDLSSAVLSKLIFGNAAKALLAGLDSEQNTLYGLRKVNTSCR